MAKGTAFIVTTLAIVAASIIVINLFPLNRNAKITSPANLKPTPSYQLLTHKDDVCGLELSYPDNLNILESPTGSVIFTGKTNAANVIIVTCQKNIPRPAIAADKIEQLKSGSVSAALYHDASATDGTPVDKLFFTNPANHLDVFISGFGAEFKQIIGNIKLIR